MHEQELIRRLQEGDPRAVDDLVDEYKAPLFAFIIPATFKVGFTILYKCRCGNG